MMNRTYQFIYHCSYFIEPVLSFYLIIMLKDKDASQGFNLKKKNNFFNESIYLLSLRYYLSTFCNMFGREKWYFTLNEGIAKEVKEIRNRCHSFGMNTTC